LAFGELTSSLFCATDCLGLADAALQAITGFGITCRLGGHLTDSPCGFGSCGFLKKTAGEHGIDTPVNPFVKQPAGGVEHHQRAGEKRPVSRRPGLRLNLVGCLKHLQAADDPLGVIGMNLGGAERIGCC
jgi:hypothetical protein